MWRKTTQQICSRVLSPHHEVAQRFSSEGPKVMAIRRETINVWERRAPLNPQHVRKLVKSGVKVIVQPSNRRAYNMQVGALCYWFYCNHTCILFHWLIWHQLFSRWYYSDCNFLSVCIFKKMFSSFMCFASFSNVRHAWEKLSNSHYLLLRKNNRKKPQKTSVNHWELFIIFYLWNHLILWVGENNL